MIFGEEIVFYDMVAELHIDTYSLLYILGDVTCDPMHVVDVLTFLFLLHVEDIYVKKLKVVKC